MPVEFALRPRFRLHESTPPVRRSPRRVPRVVLPIAAYWVGMAALTYALIHAGKGEASQPAELAVLPATPAPPLDAVLPVRPQPEPASIAWEPTAPAAAPSSDDAADESAASEPEQPQPQPPPLAVTSEPLPVAPPVPLASLELTARPEPQPLAAETLIREPAVREHEPEPATSSLPSCDAVVNGSSQDIDFAAPDRAPDLSRDAFASILENGSYLASCAVPDHSALDICVAVLEGKARGVTVVAQPGNAALSSCVRRAVARLRFPYSRRLDVTRTRFEPSR
jgi:hypothetical protein